MTQNIISGVGFVRCGKCNMPKIDTPVSELHPSVLNALTDKEIKQLEIRNGNHANHCCS